MGANNHPIADVGKLNDGIPEWAVGIKLEGERHQTNLKVTATTERRATEKAQKKVDSVVRVIEPDRLQCSYAVVVNRIIV